MKVIKLTPGSFLNVSEKLIMAILKRDVDAFKSTRMQFLRNNQAYTPDFPGTIA